MQDHVEAVVLRGRALLETRVPDRVDDSRPVAYSRVWYVPVRAPCGSAGSSPLRLEVWS